MIKIDVYDNVENARKAFEAFYELIVNDIPFPNEAISRAVKKEFRKRYGKDLELNVYKDTFNRSLNSKDESYKNILKKYGFGRVVNEIENNKKWNSNEMYVYLNYKLAKDMIYVVSNTLYALIYTNYQKDRFENEMYVFPKNDKDYDFVKSNYDGYEELFINIDMLGEVLCGYMDASIVQTLCEGYRDEKDRIIHLKNQLSKKEWKAYQKDLLENVFRFKHLDMNKTYAFVSSLGIRVCPYCNRNFVQVITKKQGNNKAFHTRPQLDHFINKSEYPFLAVSMMNLVPACGPCNLTKRDDQKRILYPYKEGISDEYQFSIKTIKSIRYMTKLQGSESEYGLEIKKSKYTEDSDFDLRVDESREVFGWDHLYDSDKEYALKVYQNRYLFNKDFQRTIVEAIPEVFSTVEEVEQILNPKLVPKERFNSEPLSKLTYDISEQARSDQEDKASEFLYEEIAGIKRTANKVLTMQGDEASDDVGIAHLEGKDHLEEYVTPKWRNPFGRITEVLMKFTKYE